MLATHTIRLFVKDPDEFGEMKHALGWDEQQRATFLKWGEYATLELVVDARGAVLGGRIVPVEEGG